MAYRDRLELLPHPLDKFEGVHDPPGIQVIKAALNRPEGLLTITLRRSPFWISSWPRVGSVSKVASFPG